MRRGDARARAGSGVTTKETSSLPGHMFTQDRIDARLPTGAALAKCIPHIGVNPQMHRHFLMRIGRSPDGLACLLPYAACQHRIGQFRQFLIFPGRNAMGIHLAHIRTRIFSFPCHWLSSLKKHGGSCRAPHTPRRPTAHVTTRNRSCGTHHIPAGYLRTQTSRRRRQAWHRQNQARAFPVRIGVFWGHR